MTHRIKRLIEVNRLIVCNSMIVNHFQVNKKCTVFDVSANRKVIIIVTHYGLMFDCSVADYVLYTQRLN